MLPIALKRDKMPLLQAEIVGYKTDTAVVCRAMGKGEILTDDIPIYLFNLTCLTLVSLSV